MSANRRSPEALSLRTFFDDQIYYLQQLVSALASRIYEENPRMEEDRQLVEGFVNATNTKMRAVNDYSDKLREPVRALYNHVMQIAEEIPPPIPISLDAFRNDPLVNALFAAPKDIERLLDNNCDLSAYLRAHLKCEYPVFYALLTANKTESRRLGISMVGETTLRDVPQEAINFSDHKIHAPCANDEELGAALKKYLFDSIVALAKDEMAARMPDPTCIVAKVSYEDMINSLANPDIYLDTLIEYLENPAKLLKIAKTHFRLSKLGIKLEPDDNQSANEFDLHELTWNDTIPGIILQIAYVR